MVSPGLRRRARPLKLGYRATRRKIEAAAWMAHEESIRARRALGPGSPWQVGRRGAALGWFRGTPNFGDELSPLIFEHLTGQKPVWVRPDFAPKVISTGSVLSYCREGDLVLGSGLIRDVPFEIPAGAVVLALRGPLTHDRAVGASADVAYGDPALLLPQMTDKWLLPSRDPDGPLGVVPHYSDSADLLGIDVSRVAGEDAVIIDVQQPARAVISAILGCRAVISSSLHGIIVAEAFGVPAVRMLLGDRVAGGSFKFDDYYLGTGREAATPHSLESALSFVREERLEAWRPDPSQIEKLLGAFSAARNLIDPHEGVGR